MRSGGYQGAVSVQVATTGGTAVAGVNYTPINQTLTFAAGQDSQTVTIPLKNAGVLSSSPTVVVGLTSAGSGVIISNPSTATVSILNVGESTLNVGQPATPPVTLESVTPVKNKKHQITEIVLTVQRRAERGGSVEHRRVQPRPGGQAQAPTPARTPRSIKLSSAVYNSANDTVTLTPKKQLAAQEVGRAGG